VECIDFQLDSLDGWVVGSQLRYHKPDHHPVLLRVVLTHNIIGPIEVVPPEPERRALSASVFTLFELWSYLVHLFTIGQLLALLFSPSSHHDRFEFQWSLSTFVMLDGLNPEAAVWLWSTVAAVAIATGVMAPHDD